MQYSAVDPVSYGRKMPSLRPNAIEVRPFKTAKDLIQALSPLGSFRLSCLEDARYASSRQFFFRGQASSDWDLTPSALRRASLLFDWNRPEPERWVAPPLDPIDQIQAEASTLWRFVSRCDDAGIAMPEDGQALRSALVRYQSIRWYLSRKVKGSTSHSQLLMGWPPPEARSLVAFAQHAGVATRLLDFTTDGYVAAFFAASSVVFCDVPLAVDKFLAIWCIPSRVIDDQFTRCDGNPLPLDHRLQILTAPSSSNRNLGAQRGLFLFDSQSQSAPGELENPTDLLSALPRDTNPILKITLPHSEAPELLCQLRQLDIHSGSLFPTPEGVAKEMAEDRKLDQVNLQIK